MADTSVPASSSLTSLQGVFQRMLSITEVQQEPEANLNVPEMAMYADTHERAFGPEAEPPIITLHKHAADDQTNGSWLYRVLVALLVPLQYLTDIRAIRRLSSSDFEASATSTTASATRAHSVSAMKDTLAQVERTHGTEADTIVLRYQAAIVLLVIALVLLCVTLLFYIVTL